MMANDINVDGQMSCDSVKKMEEDESMKKVEWLRGRLIAERAASKLAKQEAHQLECKVGELETQIKSEMNLSKRADKKLNFLIKKLNSLHIPYFPEDMEKSDISSSVTSGLTQIEEKDPNSLIKNHGNGENEGCMKRGLHQTGDKDFEDNVSQISSAGLTESEPCQNCNNAKVDEQRYPVQKEDTNEEDIDQPQGGSQIKTMAEDIGYVAEAKCEESKENNPKISDKRSGYSVDTLEDEKDTKKSTEVQDDYVDQPLALVLVDLPKEPPQARIDPLILDANVQQVLNSLNHAKQRLRFSMERRHTTRVELR